MRTWTIGALGIFGLMMLGEVASAQDLPSIASLDKMGPPAVKNPLVPQAGNYLILVKSYKESKNAKIAAKAFAEELAEHIRTNHKVQVYIEVRNWKEKQEEAARVKAELAKKREEFKKLEKEKGGILIEGDTINVKTVQIDVEYAVLIGPDRGNWKDMDAARSALDVIRKWKLPPEELCDHLLTAVQKEGGRTNIVESRPVSPYSQAFVVRNPTVPHNDLADIQAFEKEEVAIMKRINDGQEFNIFKCPKNWTLVVKGFTGNVVVQPTENSPSVLEKIFGDSKHNLLDAGAKQAEEFAKLLKDPRMKLGLRPYVLHTQKGSFVCVGEFDTEKDPKLEEARRLIAGLTLVQTGGAPQDPKMGSALGLLANPLPMKIPGR